METVLIFVGILLVLIIGHELGHFFVAKWTGMKVLEFGVGFPPKIFGKKFSADGTEYTVNWLPFGGFVRILGENQDELADPRAFPNKSALQQALVLFAGPLANILLAVVFSTVALMVGTLALVDPADAPSAQNVAVMVVDVVPESPAEQAGIQAGDRLIGFLTPEDFSTFVAESERSFVLTVQQGTDVRELTITPTSGLIDADPNRQAIGVATALVGMVSYPPHVALQKAVVDTGRDFVMIVTALGALIGSAFTFSADVSTIAGPVGIATLTGDAAVLGIGALLSFAALLSINLAIINLLPFPALDGGRLFFLAIETLTRRKIPHHTAAVINTAGFLVLIGLMVAVTVGDITRLVG
jgi:regulator of sigma E protease